MRVEHQATHWPQAKNILLQCGPYQIAGVLRAHGHEVEVDILYATWLNIPGDNTMPWDPSIVLKRWGIKSRWAFWLRSSFLAKMRRALAEGHPMLMTVRSIQGTGCLHWISAWGYDAATDEFLCYDSQCATTTNPEGNIRYSSKQLIDSLPWRGTFVVEVLGT